MWYTLLVIVHVISCVFLVTVVLLQQGKGADVGAVFGGSSQTLFGSSGAGNFLTKLTSAVAVVFMLTSLTLTYGVARQSTKSIFDDAPVTAPAPTPSEGTPAPQPSANPESQGAATAPSGESPQAAPAPTAPAQIAPAATPPAQPPPAATTPTPPEPSASSSTTAPAAK